MLSEEAFLLVVLLFACGLIGLGTLEMVSPTRPRHPMRRYDRDPWRRARRRGAPRRPSEAAVPSAPATVRLVDVVSVPPEIVREPLVSVDARLVAEPTALALEAPAAAEPAPLGVDIPVVEEPALLAVDAPVVEEPAPLVADAPVAVEPEPPVEVVEVASPVVPIVAQTREPVIADRPVDERCLALLEDRRFAEVVRLAEAHLQVRKSAGPAVPSAEAARETARLWGAIGLAKQGLDDLDGAQFALEEAIALAPQAERPIWERRLAALALAAARRTLEAGATEPIGSERIESIQSAIDWLGRGLAVSPDDTALDETLAAARDAFWAANEELVKALIKQKRFADARHRLDEVMTNPECPARSQRAFRTLRGRVMGGEAAEAAADAVRHMQKGHEDDAVHALARAGTAMAQLTGDALPPRRRQELGRKLWSAHMKLGVDRLQAGAHEAAVRLLFEALAFEDIGGERQDETRATLARALEGVVDARAVEIDALIDAGDTRAAAIQGEKLWSLLRGAVGQGIAQEHLANALGKVSALFERIKGPGSAPGPDRLLEMVDAGGAPVDDDLARLVDDGRRRRVDQ